MVVSWWIVTFLHSVCSLCGHCNMRCCLLSYSSGEKVEREENNALRYHIVIDACTTKHLIWDSLDCDYMVTCDNIGIMECYQQRVTSICCWKGFILKPYECVKDRNLGKVDRLNETWIQGTFLILLFRFKFQFKDSTHQERNQTPWKVLQHPNNHFLCNMLLKTYRIDLNRTITISWSVPRDIFDYTQKEKHSWVQHLTF